MKYYGNGVHSFKVISKDVMIGVTHSIWDGCVNIEIYSSLNIYGEYSLIEGFDEITKEQFDKDYEKVLNRISEINLTVNLEEKK